MCACILKESHGALLRTGPCTYFVSGAACEASVLHSHVGMHNLRTAVAAVVGGGRGVIGADLLRSPAQSSAPQPSSSTRYYICLVDWTFADNALRFGLRPRARCCEHAWCTCCSVSTTVSGFVPQQALFLLWQAASILHPVTHVIAAHHAQHQDGGSNRSSKAALTGVASRYAGDLPVMQKACGPTLYGLQLPDVNLGRG